MTPHDPSAPAPPGGAGIAFAEGPPPGRYAPWVASLWSLVIAHDATATEYRVVPDGCTHLVVRDGRVLLCGPRPAPEVRAVQPGHASLGIRLRPGAARAFLGHPDLPALRGAVLDLADVGGLRGLADVGRALAPARPHQDTPRSVQMWLDTLLPAATPPDPVVAAAVHAIQTGCTSIEALSDGAGLSPRQFRRRFREAVDLGPREFARIWRFRQCALAVMADDSRPWSARAADGGFADQSHLAREFARLGGLTPREFARRLRRVEHQGVWDPTRAPYRAN